MLKHEKTKSRINIICHCLSLSIFKYFFINDHLEYRLDCYKLNLYFYWFQDVVPVSKISITTTIDKLMANCELLSCVDHYIMKIVKVGHLQILEFGMDKNVIHLLFKKLLQLMMRTMSLMVKVQDLKNTAQLDLRER
jgi:hypothetical protein